MARQLLSARALWALSLATDALAFHNHPHTLSDSREEQGQAYQVEVLTSRGVQTVDVSRILPLSLAFLTVSSAAHLSAVLHTGQQCCTLSWATERLRVGRRPASATPLSPPASLPPPSLQDKFVSFTLDTGALPSGYRCASSRVDPSK